jgi:DnaK suppressor protein
MLGDRDRAKIQQVDRALEWIEEDEYGLCEECGEPVGDNRMRALLFTRVCVECKSKFERNSLHKGRLDDGPHGMGEKVDNNDESF